MTKTSTFVAVLGDPELNYVYRLPDPYNNSENEARYSVAFEPGLSLIIGQSGIEELLRLLAAALDALTEPDVFLYRADLIAALESDPFA